MTDRAWFSSYLQHLARKWSGSILTTRSPHGADIHTYLSTCTYIHAYICT